MAAKSKSSKAESKIGRPSKLTPELQSTICATVEESGCDWETAAICEGITRQTCWNWRKKGREGCAPFAAFLDDAARARATWRKEALRKLEDPLSYVGDPRIINSFVRALQWKLEALERDLYGPQVTVKLAQAREQFGEALDRVCLRMGAREVAAAVYDELERLDRMGGDGQAPEGGAADRPPDVH